MPNQREFYDDPEEGFRAAWAGIRAHMWTALPVFFSQDSADGHTGTLQPAVKRPDDDTSFATTTFSDLTILPTAPIHHPGGGGITSTFPSKAGDEGIAIFASRSIDGWHQSGGVQQPIFNRLHSLSDAMVIPGLRSDPRKLHQVSQVSGQTRTDDKRSVIDHGPNGTKIKTADPSTAAASESFDPFASATKFFEHLVHPTDGHASNAVDGGTTHAITNTHSDGPKLSATNGAHTVNTHPENGVGIKSSTAHTIDAPNASLDMGGNLSAKQNITSSSGNIAAPSGNVSGQSGSFGSGFLGGLQMIGGLLSGGGGGSGSPSLMVAPEEVSAATLRTNTDFTVAGLSAAMPPSAGLRGVRAHVTDADGPAFMAPLVGGGAVVCPAFCDGTTWIAA